LHQRNQEIEIFGATDLTLCRSKIVWFQATDVWAIRQGKARQGKARQGKATQRNATQRNATITPTLGKLFEHLRTNDIRMITVPKVEAPILAQRFVNHDPHRTWKGAPRLHRALDKSLTATMNRQR
jgi:hypothetical protein